MGKELNMHFKRVSSGDSTFFLFVIHVLLQEREAMNMGNLYPGLEHLQSHAVCLSVPQVHQVQVTYLCFFTTLLFHSHYIFILLD